LADKKETKKDGERNLTFNLQRRQTSERVIFRPTAVTNITRGRKRVIKRDGAVSLSDPSEL